MEEQNQQITYFLIDDDLYVEAPGLRGALKLPDPKVLFADPTGFLESKSFITPQDTARPVDAPVFKYGRMFRNPELPEYRPKEKGLIDLGYDMGEETSPGDNPGLPAGYVYLGQFIDHDLSFNAMTNRLPLGEGSVQDEKNLRSPSLDLDSLYGLDPSTFKQTELGMKVYKDEVMLSVGPTIADSDVPGLPVFQNDLPREGDPKKSEAAAVADPRNDENLIVAQTHLTFIKFHNAVVETLKGTLTGEALFDAAREQVVRHYQWIILRDYLPKIIEEKVLEEIVENGCTYLQFGEEEEASVPFEFAMAAYRFGHTQVNVEYEWNRVFQSNPPGFFSASLNDLFMFTGFGQKKLFNRLRLPSSWVIDWTRFFDFTDIPEVVNSQHSNRARSICPSLVTAMTKL
ncbi:MAG: peroxidase family protein, partial [Pyrinomonadaceae bacterium]